AGRAVRRLRPVDARPASDRADVREEFAGDLSRAHRVSVERAVAGDVVRRPTARGSGAIRVSRRLNLTITCETGREFVPFLWTNVRRAYAAWASKIRQSQNMGPTPMLRELSVALIGDRRMSALHQEFMGIAGTTDVLSFPLEADARGRVISGEVVVCIPQARRQAKIRQTAAKHELLLY